MPDESILVGNWQQAPLLRDLIIEAGFRHGQKAVVDLPRVGFYTAPGETTTIPVASGEQNARSLYFCDVPELRNVRTITDGDDEADIPQKVYIDPRLPFPEHHELYDLFGVELTTNGVILISATPDTQFVPVMFERESVADFAAT